MQNRIKFSTIYNRIALRNKIGILTAVTVSFAFLISLFSMYSITDAYNEQLYQVVSDNLYSNTSQLSKQLETLESLSMMTLASSAVQSSLESINEGGSTNQLTANATISRAMSTYLQSYNYTGLRAITIFNNYYFHNTDYNMTNSMQGEIAAAINKSIDAKGSPTYTFIPDKNMILLSRSIRQIANLSLKHLGDMVFFIDLDTFMNVFDDHSNSFISSFYLLYCNDELTYSSAPIDRNVADTLYKNASSSYKITDIGKDNYFYVMNQIPGHDWYLLHAIPYNTLTSGTAATVKFILLIFLVAFVTLILINSLTLRFALGDYQKLVTKMKNFSLTENENVTVDPNYADRTDELGMLHRQFDLMSVEIHDLIEKNYVNELLRRDAQLKELKSQINPHFLYNTLETINWRAKAINDKKISAITESLGFIFRASLDSKTSLVTLSYELDLINAYMVIQSIRFEDRLKFTLSCPDDLKSSLLPPMTVQPLLENSIKYGMETMIDVCELNVDIVKEGPNIVIMVSNDGSYFEDDLINKLENGKIKPNGHGIGLLNIDKRIKLLFGEEYGLIVYNNEEDMAVAKITIPYTTNNEEEKR